MPPPGWNDQEIEVRMGNLLRWGITIASLLMLAGAIFYLPTIWSAPADFTHFKPATPITWSLQGNAVIRIGIILLIATPVARVIFSAYAFYRQKDMQYVWISLAVLLLLALGLTGEV